MENETRDVTNATSIPKANGVVPILWMSKADFLNSKSKAPSTEGMERMKEVWHASSSKKFKIKRIDIVIPDLEMPGKTAMPWNKPNRIEVIKIFGFFLIRNFLEAKSIVEVITKPIIIATIPITNVWQLCLNILIYYILIKI